MSNYKYIDTDDDFQSCVISFDCEVTKRDPNDSDMILYNTGLISNKLTTNKGHYCNIPYWNTSYTIHNNRTQYKINIKYSGNIIKYETNIDGDDVNIIKELNDDVFNVVLSVNNNISMRKKPSYKGIFKGYIMKTNPNFTKSYPSSKNILFDNVFQMWKTGHNKYSLDYHYEHQNFHISDDIAFAIASAMFHDNE